MFIVRYKVDPWIAHLLSLRAAVDVQWAYPKEFSDVIVRLGGMHMLMSFVGAVGALMQGSGLAEICKRILDTSQCFS